MTTGQVAKDDLSRPSVEVKLPEVRLRLEDLAYLRNLTQDKSIRCHPKNGVLDRLRFLDLIARAKVQPDASVITDVREKTATLKRELHDALKAENWDRVRNKAYELDRQKSRLDAREDDVLTDKGRAILKHGEAKVRVRKVGCV